MDPLCFCVLCFSFYSVCSLLACAPAGKGLTSGLLLVMFIVFVLLSHVVSYLIVSYPYLCLLSYFTHELK